MAKASCQAFDGLGEIDQAPPRFHLGHTTCFENHLNIASRLLSIEASRIRVFQPRGEELVLRPQRIQIDIRSELAL